MKIKYTYEFANGDKATVLIEQSDFELLSNLDRLERNANRRESRQHKSLDTGQVNERFLAIDDDTVITLETQEQNRALIKALGQLPDFQQDLIRKIFFDEIQAIDIAQKEGVSRAAISQRLSRALMSLKKLLLQTVNNRDYQG